MNIKTTICPSWRRLDCRCERWSGGYSKLFECRVSLILLVAAVGLVGCGGGTDLSATVQGSVTLSGQLVESGTVTFHPVGGGPIAYGKINHDGTFALRTGQGDLRDPDSGGVAPGEYIATVVVLARLDEPEVYAQGGPPTPPPRLTPEKYASKETSDLRVTVEAGRNVIALPLEATPLEATDAEGESDVDEGTTNELTTSSDTDQSHVEAHIDRSEEQSHIRTPESVPKGESV